MTEIFDEVEGFFGVKRVRMLCGTLSNVSETPPDC